MDDKTIYKIEKYIRANNDKLEIEISKLDTISFSEIGPNKRMRTKKTVYKASVGNDSLFIVKYFVDKKEEHILIKEFENLQLINEMEVNGLICGPIFLTDIDNKKVLIQKYFEGVTIQEVFRQKLFTTTSFITRFSSQVFSLITDICRKLNSTAEKASKDDLSNDLNQLVNNYSKVFCPNNLDEIKKLTNSFIERYPEDEIFKRVVLLDAFPCNIIFNFENKRGYLIDLEYIENSTLNFLEPLRAVFFFIRFSYELSNWIFFTRKEKFSNVILKKRIGRLGGILNDFLKDNTVIGRIDDFDFLRTIILIFFMAEALLQNRASPFQTNNKNSYSQFVDIIASSNNVDSLLSSTKEESDRLFIRNSIIKKAFKYLVKSDTKEILKRLIKSLR